MRIRTRTTIAIVPFLSLGLLLAACEQTGPADPGAMEDLLHAGDPVAERIAAPPASVCAASRSDLLAGQSLVVGSVEVANDGDYVYVTIRTQDGWTMTESHLAITHDPDLIPKQGQRIAPGRFPDRTVHDPAETEVTYRVPRSVLSGESVAVVAAHADVVKGELAEGAWIAGAELRSGGSWASYAEYEIVDCVGTIDGDLGGEVTTTGATLAVLPGSFEGTQEIALYPVPTDELPEGALPGTAFDFDPDGLEFDPPAELEVAYDDTGLSLTEEQALALHYLTPAGIWEEVPSSSVDTEANLITALIEHFSVYAVVPQVAELTLSVSPQPVDETGTLTHDITIENQSADDLTGVEVRVLAEGPVNTPAYPGECNAFGRNSPPELLFVCTVDVPAGQMASLQVSVNAQAGSGGSQITSSAELRTASQHAVTPAIVTDIVALDRADIRIELSVSPQPVTAGSPLTHDITVTNDGPDPSGDITVRLVIDEDVLFQSVPSECSPFNPPGVKLAECVLPGLGNGASATLQVVVVPQTAGQTLSSTASIEDVQGAFDPNGANDESTTSTPVQTAAPTGADLSIALADAPDPVDAGDPLTYDLSVVNAGPEDVTGVEASLIVHHASNLPGPPTIQGSCQVLRDAGVRYIFLCDLGDLAANDAADVQITLNPVDAGTLAAEAAIEQFTGATDPDGANDTAEVETTVVAPAAADLSIAIADSPDPVTVGNALTYDVTVANAGPDPVTDVEYGLVVYHASTLTTPASYPGDCSLLRNSGVSYLFLCTAASLGANASITSTIQIEPIDEGPLDADADITGFVGAADPDLGDNSDSEVTTVEPQSSAYDGRLLFWSDRNGTYDLYLKDLSTDAVTQLTFGERVLTPEWSPDGTRIAYSAAPSSGNDYDIRVLTVATGAIQTVATGFRANSPTWSPDATRLAYTSYTQTISTNQFDWDVHVVDLATLSDQVVANSDYTDTEPDWSSDGTRIAFLRERPVNSFEVVAVDVATNTETVIYNGLLQDMEWSADDTRIVASQWKTQDPIYEIVILDVASGSVTDVTAEGTRSVDPVWSPDGSLIAFARESGTSGYDIHVVPVTGGSTTLLEGSASQERSAGWRP